jgi:hypothetical protein
MGDVKLGMSLTVFNLTSCLAGHRTVSYIVSEGMIGFPIYVFPLRKGLCCTSVTIYLHIDNVTSTWVIKGLVGKYGCDRSLCTVTNMFCLAE